MSQMDAFLCTQKQEHEGLFPGEGPFPPPLPPAEELRVCAQH